MKVNIVSYDKYFDEARISKEEIKNFIKYSLPILRKRTKKIIPGFSIIFVTKEKIRNLNKTFRSIDEATDVLSFESDEKGYLGDVILSCEIVSSYAQAYNCVFKEELLRDILHGVLHLVGFDHAESLNDNPGQELFTIQEKILHDYISIE